MIQEDQNDYEGAIKEYVKAKKSNNPIRALNDIARCQYWSKKYSEAKQTCELILRETEKSDDTGFRIAAYLRLADIAKRGLLDGVNVKEAVSLYERIVDEYSDNRDAIANLALLYESQPELDTQKSRRHYENLIRLRPAERLSDEFFHLGSFERLEVWLSLAHAFANGICCDKDYRIALRCYFLCASYYDFSHYEAYANMAKNDLKKIKRNVDTDNRDIQYYIAYIDYELYSDAQKIMELVEKGICDWEYESLAAIIYEEEFGAKKLEKRKAYYLTGDDNLYKSIQDPSLLWEFIKPYGRDIFMNETQNI
jgi:tetratricopeptide (TPR) repeat protein